jgi:hypothetical protein
VDWLTFISEIVSSIAWPLVAVVVVFLIRPAILKLLPGLNRVKGFGIEADFGRELEQVRELSDESSTVSPPVTKTGISRGGEVLALAELSPRSAVLESWRELEAVVSERVPSRDGEQRVSAARALVDSGLLDETSTQIFMMLRGLRNRAAHEPVFEIRAEEAVEYGILVQHLIDQIAHAAE